MVCYHPLKAWPIGLTKNNKIDYKITNYDIKHLEIYENDKINESNNNKISPYAKRVIYSYKEVPCGHCIGCRLDYSRQWADRCLVEMKQHKESYFVTLTYNDDNLHVHNYVDKITGVCGEVASLDKRDFQKFMKRLRKNYKYENKIRFFAAGEYGDHTLRPHYHAIIFGLHLDDLKLYKQNELGQNLYTSEFLEKTWSLGFVVVAPATWETCAYVARYMLKKQKGETSDIYKEYNFEPEFSLMSRKPGIGRNYFDEKQSSMFDTDCLFIATPDGSKKFYPSRYYKKLFEAFDEEKYIDYKERKDLVNKDIKRIKKSLTTNNYIDMLQVEEHVRRIRSKALVRKEV